MSDALLPVDVNQCRGDERREQTVSNYPGDYIHVECENALTWAHERFRWVIGFIIALKVEGHHSPAP